MDHDLESEWNENMTQTFLDLGKYFVPERERQVEILCSLLPLQAPGSLALEICCGEGLLAEAILEHYTGCRLTGLDGSEKMLEQAGRRLARFGERFRGEKFQLEDRSWRLAEQRLQAVVSSLAIHHLDRAGKQQLYQDLFQMLAPGGALVIADLVLPAGKTGINWAARAWDEEVRRRCSQIDGHERRFQTFQELEWNTFRFPDPMDRPSPIFDQLTWLSQAGFSQVDIYWLHAGHAVYGGVKPE